MFIKVLTYLLTCIRPSETKPKQYASFVSVLFQLYFTPKRRISYHLFAVGVGVCLFSITFLVVSDHFSKSPPLHQTTSELW